jgi:phosphate transport system permease protein
MGKKVLAPRVEEFKGTDLEKLFPYMEQNLKSMMRPRTTFYWRFLFDKSFDSHIFGGIWAEMLGTFYLVLGTMIFAIPIGVIAAIYLTEFAKPGRIISLLRTCISTLAGVPSIVFGLFGLAFFINTIKVSDSKSVLAGSLTLAILVLPTIIRASEEAILAVPKTYKEAAFSLGASRIHTVLTVILPAALPGILTGIVISMGRAAGETAPIIFTAAVSVGKPLKLFETLNQPTPALPWNIYNLVTEHEAVDQIRHVQFGMVFTLVLLVLLLNLGAIILRARVSKKLRG